MDSLELAGLAAWSFAVAVAGGAAGLVLGNLRLPLMVMLASSPAAGAGANVAVSGVGALVAGIAHGRGGRIDWRLFWWMAPASVAGGLAGGLLSGLLPGDVLLVVIAAVVLYGAVAVLRQGRRGAEPRAAARPRAAAAIALLVGVAGGIVGLILGSLRLPALVRWAGISAHAAVGTNSAVGVLVAVGAVAGHLASGIDWELFAVAAAATVPGAWVGAGITGRLDEQALLRAIALILFVAGAGLVAQAILG